MSKIGLLELFDPGMRQLSSERISANDGYIDPQYWDVGW